MIDFRYHIVSIVAVFLALGIGLLMGSGVLGDPLLENIRDRARDVQEFNDRLKRDVDDLNSELTVYRQFAEAVEEMLVAGVLTGRDVVIVDVSERNAPLDALVETIEDRAGGSIASIVTTTEKFALVTPEAVDDLQGVTGLALLEAEDLRTDSARQLGNRIAVLAEGRLTSPSQRSMVLLQSLEESGFVDIAEEDEETPIPEGASFVVVASGGGEPLYPVDDFVTALGAGLVRGSAPIVVVETAESTWGAVEAVRDDGDLSDRVDTVDNIDRLSGRIALVMSLDRDPEGEAGHFGEKGGASSVIPDPGQRD